MKGSIYHGIEFSILFVYPFNVEDIDLVDLGLIQVQEEVLSVVDGTLALHIKAISN